MSPTSANKCWGPLNGPTVIETTVTSTCLVKITALPYMLPSE